MAATALVIIAVGVAAFWQAAYARQRVVRVAHTYEVLSVASAALAALQDIESGQRGYLLTGRASDLERHAAAMAALTRDTATLRTLTKDNIAQQRRLDSLAPLVAERISVAEEAIERRRTRGLAAALAVVQRGDGARAMAESRRLLNALTRDEQRRAAAREARAASAGLVSAAVASGGVVLVLAIVLLLGFALSHDAASQAESATELAFQNERLQDQAVELELQQQHLQDQAVELELQSAQLADSLREVEEARDVAEQARHDAERANRVKRDFLAMMSHELRTPLNAIAGYTQLLEMELYGPVTQRQTETLARIDRAQHHLLTLITSILDYARIEAAKVEYDIQAVELQGVVREAMTLVEAQLSERRHVATSVLPDEGVQVWADRAKLTQVLLNLLANAVKFTPQPGRIEIEVAAPSQHPSVACLYVRDTGVGIPPDKLESVFQPFVQVDTRHSRSQDGTGLGLAISRELARGMGGDVTVESVVGEGSCFALTLRRVVTAGGEPAERRRSGEHHSGAGRRRAERRSGEDRRQGSDAPTDPPGRS